MNSQIIPTTMRIKDAESFIGLSRSKIYRLAGEGKIKLKKASGRTLVETQSLISYAHSLPDAKISPCN
jgi:hypothetical protein